MALRILPGRPHPLGATWDGHGVNFAVFSENAESVELCFYDSIDPTKQTSSIRVREQTAHVWHCYIPGIRPSQLYGYRVHGPFRPEHGLRFNPAKLLIDPYAKAVAGEVNWEAPVFAYQMGDPGGDMTFDDRDDAWGKPKAVVVDTYFDWDGDRAPRVPFNNTVIYEVHVKGFTMQHPDVPEEDRGRYSGIAAPVILDYLKTLGVTAVELLPVHDFLHDKFLRDKGLRNYWGYNTTSFFAPHAGYSCGDRGEQVADFKQMVKALHRAGIEVILDVVYNHTSEGSELGPTLNFRGFDNTAYYRLVHDQPRYYMNYSGTGNTLNSRHPQVLKLIMDSLRYWVLEMHVDGFRFDLASALARELHSVDRLGSFFDIIHQDPVLSTVKLIAEPWDVGDGGYQVGNFPVLWAEWNDKYRDTVRKFWRGDEDQMAELGWRLTGSSDLYQEDGRNPFASINYVVSHDGFTLHDVVSYAQKHNEANGEANRDGHDNNLSCNYGHEGETDDPQLRRIRQQQKRNFLATLLFSQGVPMLCGGDEIGRTQRGNNNAYCQDNELSWFNWQLNDEGQDLFQFACRVIALRQKHPALHRRKFFQGRGIQGRQVFDVEWFRPDGHEMSDEEWSEARVRSLGMLLNGQLMDEWDERGKHIHDDILLLLLNANADDIPFVLPHVANGESWEMLLDTALPDGKELPWLRPGRTYLLQGRSLALLRQRPRDA